MTSGQRPSSSGFDPLTEHSIATDLVLTAIIEAMESFHPNARAKIRAALEAQIKGVTQANPAAAPERQRSFDVAREIIGE